MKSFSQFAEEAKKDYFRLNPGDKSIENSILRNYNKRQKKYASSNLSPDAQDFLDDVSKKTKIGPNTVQNFKNRLDAIKRGENPDAPSTQLQGKTKEQIVRDAESGRTADEGKFKTNKNTTNNTVKTNQKVNKVTQSKTDLKPNQKQLTNTDLDNINKPSRTIDKKLKSIEKTKTKTKPRTIVKQFTTQPKSKTDLKGIVQRGLERTGVVDPKPQKEVKGKLKPISKTDLKNTKLKTNIVKKTPKGLKAVRGLSTLGRIAGGAFAVQDFLSTAKREKAMGRGKTAARLAGLSKALGGYVGGGIGATLGAGVASLPGGIAGGAAGYHYGSKLGDKVYQTGRDLVTGKKTFKQLRKDIGKGLNTTKQGLNKRWNQYIDYKD